MQIYALGSMYYAKTYELKIVTLPLEKYES